MSHMSPVGTPGTPGDVVWTQHVSPDGRPFWNNVKTGQSVWEKPSELKSAAEREIERTTPWKEYETGGRKYWVHAESKETTWEMPAVVREIVDKFAQGTPMQPGAAAAGPGAAGNMTPGGPLTAQSGALVSAPNAPGLPSKPQISSGFQSQFLPPNYVPGGPVEFPTAAEAERAFMGMLGEVGVTPEWTWDKVMRETVTNPLYKALKSMAERKAAFEKYVDEQIKNEKELQQKSIERCRKDWNKAMDKLGGGPEKPEGIKAWWTWQDSGKRELKKRMSEDVWNEPRNDAERKILFEEYVDALKAKEQQKKDDLRKLNMAKVTDLLQLLKLDLGGTARWRDAERDLYDMSEWRQDPDLQRMEPIDILIVFEEETRKAEQAAAEIRAKAAEDRRRQARKAREGFTTLLEELRLAGRIRSGTPWKSIYPYVEDDERYQALLGQPGSSPLDLFWDTVDKLDLQIEADERIITAAMRDHGFEIHESTTFDEFSKAIESDQRIGKINRAVIETVFEKLLARTKRQAREERRRAERKLRVLIDDLRYAYKKLDPPVDLESSYEDNLDRIKETPEYLALEGDDESRRAAFEKFVRRQKEKLRDRERDDYRERDRDRDRDRVRERRDRSVEDDGGRRSSRHYRDGTEEADDRTGSQRRRSARDGSADGSYHSSDGRHPKRSAAAEGETDDARRRSKYPRVDSATPRRSEDVVMSDRRPDREEGEI